ncbi:MAG: DUF3500 domain-containing protein [Planctomycetota bacterium]
MTNSSSLSRRQLLKTLSASTALLTVAGGSAATAASTADSLPMQLYKSLSDEQRQKICLPINHKSRGYISNWWYVHRDHRVNNTFKPEQQQLIQEIFDSLHSEEHRDAVNAQVEIDQYGEAKNAPSVGFFGSPDDEDFEFIFTGHHVTRRCNAHTDEGQGFGGAPIFYGHFPTDFNEKPDHPGNPYWYQGKIFNEFVQCLDGKQQEEALVSNNPRSERSNLVLLKKQADWPGLSCKTLSPDQKQKMIATMRKMLAMFRSDDVEATLKLIEDKDMLDRLFVSFYDGKYDIGNDQVWDTWQIEGPDMVWYFRGEPHIHSYFHVKS